MLETGKQHVHVLKSLIVRLNHCGHRAPLSWVLHLTSWSNCRKWSLAMAGSFKRRRQERLLGEKQNKNKTKQKQAKTKKRQKFPLIWRLSVGRWADSFIKDGLCYVTAFCPFVADGQGCDDMAWSGPRQVRLGFAGGGSRRAMTRCIFWPSARRGVKKYCRSCAICQRTTPQGRVPSVPLQLMPSIEETIQRHRHWSGGSIQVCSVWQAPMHSYDHWRSWGYIPLKQIDIVTVAEALFSVFAREGVPHGDFVWSRFSVHVWSHAARDFQSAFGDA